MNLTPEQKAIGRENFYAAVGSGVKLDGERESPRDFLKEADRRGVTCGGRPNAKIDSPLNPASNPSLGEYYFHHDSPPASRLRVGVIGTGDEGSVLIGAINPNYIDVRAIADIRPYNIHRAFYGDYSSATARSVRCGLMAKYGWKTKEEGGVKEYGPYEELIANAQRDGIEAVIIALPLHLHAPAAIKAMRAGLHVLTEKLMGHSVRECKEMALVAQQTGMILATGHQRHYNILYDRAVDLIKRGALGDLHYIRAQWHRGNLPHSDSWQQPMPRAIKPDDPKSLDMIRDLEKWAHKLEEAKQKVEDLKKKKPAQGIADWEKKIKKWEGEVRKWEREIDKYQSLVDQVNAQMRDATLDAARYGYKDAEIRDAAGNVVYRRPAMEELIRWRLWDRTGGGLMAELGSHQLDAASIFIAAVHGGKKQYPLSVAAAANRPIFPPDRETDDHVFCLFEFPAPGYYEEDGKTVRDK
ncbi:MAG TPA: Gfo/Idh/MocA family oxidoreductase, partial [Thermoguttaceae bacterium]|nr:Gfo/Idh/MocA family oxidoreductase [Thermoguttaceae bacterium]